MTGVDTARDALDLVGRDPRAALDAADAIVARIPRPRTPDEIREVATAHRAAGLSLRYLGQAPAAERRLRTAIRLAERHGLGDLAAESRMTIAYVLLGRGDVRGALLAVDLASADASTLEAAHVRATRALVLQHAGRTTEALREYAAALTVFERQGDGIWESRLRSNRALLRAYLGDTAAAVADLTRARELALGLGLTDLAASYLCNLAWVVAMSGAIPESLELFQVAESEGAALEQPEHWVDRAEILLRAGLIAEATASARAAVSWHDGRGLDALAAEATMLLALCLVRSGDLDAAQENAERARRWFRKQDRPTWAALAECVTLQSRLTGPVTSAALDGAVRTASVLSEVGWADQSADLRLAAARAALSSGDARRARTLLGPLATKSSSRPQVRSRAQLARALLQEQDGDLEGAESALRASWRSAEALRALVGSTELRAVSGSIAGDIVSEGLRLSVAQRHPRRTFAWAEKGRAAALRYQPALPPDDPDMARALTRLRWAARADDDATLEGMRDTRTARARAQLEREVIGLTRTARGADRLPPVELSTVVRRIGRARFLQYLEVDEHYWLVEVSRSGSSLLALGPSRPIHDLVDTMNFSLRRLALGHGTPRGLAAAQESLTRSALALDDLAVGPARGLLGDEPVVICASGPLVKVSWSVLPSMRGRQVSVAPSATLWCRASDASVGDEDRVLAVAGPGLPAAVDEVTAIAEVHRAVTVLVGDDATTAAVTTGLDAVRVLHLAAHGTLRRDNPLFSTIELADGPLTGYDLEQLRSVPPVVVLPACHSGAGHQIVAEETLGLAWTLMGAGSANVIAPLISVPDAPTREVMVGFHTNLAAGAAPSAALADAQLRFLDADPQLAATASAFVAYGT